MFPGGPRTCGILGLPELPADYQVQAARFTEFFERSADVLAECTGTAELQSKLRTLSSDFGYPALEAPSEPLRGRDCVGGFPRPLALLYMLSRPLDHVRKAVPVTLCPASPSACPRSAPERASRASPRARRGLLRRLHGYSPPETDLRAGGGHPTGPKRPHALPPSSATSRG